MDRLNKMKIQKTLISISIIVIVLGGINHHLGWLRFNTSPSLPYGLYLCQDEDTLNHDDLVLFCLNDEQAKFASERGYIDKGNCPIDTAPLGKYVKAVPNDKIDIFNSKISVNGSVIENSATLAEDNEKRPLTPAKLPQTLGNDEYLMLSPKENSYDSRYLGVIKKEQVIGVLHPLITFD